MVLSILESRLLMVGIARMPDVRDKLRNVAHALQQAGSGGASWHEALNFIAALVGGAGGAVFELDRTTGRFGRFFVNGLEPGAGDYIDRMNRINPRMQYSLKQRSPHVVCDHQILPERVLARHEFYNWMERTNGTRYFVGARVFDRGTTSVFASVEFTPGQGHPDAAQIEAFKAILPHVEDAWCLSETISRLDSQVSALAFAYEAIPWGVVVLDGRGTLVSANEKARRLLASADGLELVDGRLRATHPTSTRALTRMIHCKLADPASKSSIAAATCLVRRRQGKLPLALRVCVLPRNTAGSNVDAPAMMVFVSALDEPPAVGQWELQALFGLSKQESALALPLAESVALPEAADRLGISYNTCRVHLRRVLEKTGTHSQLQLVRLFHRLP